MNLAPDSETARKQVLAIVPAYNEEATVAEVVKRLQKGSAVDHVVVINDGSTDRTAAVAIAADAVVISLPFSLGIGGAMQTGFRFAEESGFGHAVQVDGDGQHDPAEVAQLFRALENDPDLDMVVGSRFLGIDIHKSTVSRRLGMRIFATLLSLIMRKRITDPTSGFRIVNRHDIELFARDYPHDYPEVETLLMVHAHSLNMCEIPVKMHNRGGGKSSISATSSIYYMIKVLLAIFIGLFRAHPNVKPGDEAPAQAVGHME